MSARIGVRLKEAVESTVGLGLGDAVNVSIFVLTIISLIVAFAGVWYAAETLADAREAGKAQTKALSDQVTALNDASAFLKTLLDQIKEQKKSVDKQTALLESVQQSTSQSLSQLRAENARQERSPQAEVSLQCLRSRGEKEIDYSMDEPPDPNSEEDVFDVGRIEESMAQMEVSFPRREPTQLWCISSLHNPGPVSIQKASFSWSVRGTNQTRSVIRWIFPMYERRMKQTEQEKLKEFNEHSLGTSAGPADTLYFLRDAEVYPQSISGRGETFDFFVIIPWDGSEFWNESFFQFSYTLESSNLPFVSRTLFVHITWPYVLKP